MRIGVLSDTHDEFERTERAVSILRARQVDALIHCGDLASPRIIEICSAIQPFYFVFGNHDSDVVPDLKNAADKFGAECLEWGGLIPVGEKSVGVVHGHLKSDLKPVAEASPEYLCFGHFHCTMDFLDGPTRRINPGALARVDEPSVAILDTVEDSVEFLVVRLTDTPL